MGSNFQPLITSNALAMRHADDENNKNPVLEFEIWRLRVITELFSW
jgi:hypothetical protein